MAGTSGVVVIARQDEQGPGIGGFEAQLIAVERVCDDDPTLLERFRFHPSFAGIPEPVLRDPLLPLGARQARVRSGSLAGA